MARPEGSLRRARRPDDEVVGDRLVDEGSRCSRALLAGEAERAARSAGGGEVEVGRGSDDHRVLAAHLTDRRLRVRRASSGTAQTRGRTSG